MTTFDPGASVVLTHGLRCRPFSTAFFASSAAPTMTDGLDVLVHDVIAAIATAPWSISKSVPSDRVTRVGWEVRPLAPVAAEWTSGAAVGRASDGAAGSEAGNDSADASSCESWIESPSV